MTSASGMLQMVIVIAVGAALVGTVVTFTNDAADNLTGYGGASALIKLLPLVFVAILVFFGIKGLTNKNG